MPECRFASRGELMAARNGSSTHLKQAAMAIEEAGAGSEGEHDT